MNVQPVPPGYHTVTPFLTVQGAADLIGFLQQAFGAVELERIARPDGLIAHAEVKIGDSLLMLTDPRGDCGTSPGTFYLYLPEVDVVYNRALAAGGESIMPPANQFWGDRTAGVRDRFGNRWWLASRGEDLSAQEIEKRMAAAMAAPAAS